MSVDITTNMTALSAANNLAASNMQLQKSIAKLSSGSKIVNPSDDAGGLAVSMKLTAAANRDAAVNSNIADATSFLQTQDGAMQVAGSILNRMSELKTLYSDPTKNSTDLSNYTTEFNALQSQLSSIATGTFNGVSLFSSTALSVSTTEDGSTTGSVSVGGQNLTDTSSGIGAVLSDTTSSALSDISLSSITTAIQNLATYRADNGATQSRLSFASSLVTSDQQNLTAASGQITDVDVASESTNLAKWNVLVQSGTSMLAQANQSAQVALKLLS